jgi:hypothetical protein
VNSEGDAHRETAEAWEVVARAKYDADSALAIVLEFTGDMARDTEMSQLLTQGTEGWDSLSEPDRARLAYLLFRMFKILENIHYYQTLGTLDEETWEGWKNLTLYFAHSPAGRFYLDVRKHWFTRRFLEFIDSEVGAGERLPTKSLAQMGMGRQSPEYAPGGGSPADHDG